MHIPRPSLKQVLLAGIGSSIGVFGLLVTVALSIVEFLTHPKRKTASDLYTLSPYEFDLPAEAVMFPPRHGDYLVTGWYIPYPQATTTILVCPGYRSRAADMLGIINIPRTHTHHSLIQHMNRPEKRDTTAELSFSSSV